MHVLWNYIRAAIAAIFAAGPAFAQPANDDCANAIVIDSEFTPFTNVGATTDGRTACAPYEFDVWFYYQPDQAGYLTVSTCSPALTFDTVVSVFENPNQRCDNNSSVCNDDAGDPNCPAGGSAVRLFVRTGHDYLIHVGGFEGQTGSGELLVRLCAGDFDGDRMVALSDLAIMLSEFGSTSNCGTVGCRTDMDGDGVVGLVDLAIMLELFATFCP